MDSDLSEVAALDTWAAPLDPSIFGLSAQYPTTRRAELAASGDLVVVDEIDMSFGGVRALCGVSLTVRKGDIHAIIGPNGAGKSSLLNVIGGIYRPDRGRVTIAGQTFGRVPTQRLAKLGVARTFQNLALFKGLSVRDNVMTGRVGSARATFLENIVGWGRARREENAARVAADAVIDFLDLGAFRERLAGMLPYGVQKRVELARALVARPRLLLLDEPMAGMTATEKQEMSGFIRATREQFQVTVILIEHDIGVVMGLSDRVTVLDYGRKIAEGAPEAVQSDQAVIDAYLGVAHSENSAEIE
jgi:branched-chain amino acid transport system ATP-binding protein